MGLQLEVDKSPFWWEWDEDPEVRIKCLPINPAMHQKVGRETKLGITLDGRVVGSELFEMRLGLAKLSFQEFEGILLGGNRVKCDDKGIKVLAQNAPEVMIAAVDAATEEWDRRKERTRETEGNSDSQPAG